jgi:phytoene dehydrogenase-like protein
MAQEYDAIVIGSGPNGLAAACTRARAGCSVCVFEARGTAGGGARTAELTLPGFAHDVCSAIHPLGIGSPFLRTLPLSDFGLEWIHSQSPLAHPFEDGTAVLCHRPAEETAAELGVDAGVYKNLLGPFVHRWRELLDDTLAPIHMPRHPLLLADFSRHAIQSADSFAHHTFTGPRARALFGGLAGHSLLPFDHRPGAAFGLLLGILAHAVGWPLPRGGSQRISDALAGCLKSMGGEIRTNAEIASLDDLPKARAILCDVTPRQLLKIAGGRLNERYRAKLERYRYGVGVFKIDWALKAPIPWKNAQCFHAATVHLGGSFENIRAAESEVARGGHPGRPFVILTQPSLFDPARAPSGRHTAWAYCHVPNGSTKDMTGPIEAQIEAAAPGFRDCVMARHTLTTQQLQAYNPNYIGGDINGGVQDLAQVLKRPIVSMSPYRTPARGLYICSSSTPPGGGVHGMCGFHAARAALEDLGIPAM